MNQKKNYVTHAKHLTDLTDFYYKIEIDNKFDEYYDWTTCDKRFVSKTDFNSLESRLAALEVNYISKDSLTNIFAKSLTCNMINKLDSAELYEQLSKQYIAGLEITDCFYLYCKTDKYPNERFMVGSYIDTIYNTGGAGFTFVYNFK